MMSDIKFDDGELDKYESILEIVSTARERFIHRVQAINDAIDRVLAEETSIWDPGWERLRELLPGVAAMNLKLREAEVSLLIRDIFTARDAEDVIGPLDFEDADE